MIRMIREDKVARLVLLGMVLLAGAYSTANGIVYGWVAGIATLGACALCALMGVVFMGGSRARAR